MRRECVTLIAALVLYIFFKSEGKRDEEGMRNNDCCG